MKTYVITKKLFTNVYSIIMYNSYKMKTRCPSTDEWINNVVYWYNGILFNNKKQCWYMLQHVWTLKILFYVLRFHLYEVSKIIKSIGLRWGNIKTTGFWEGKNVKLDFGDGCTTMWIYKKYIETLNYILIWVNYTVCEL